MQNQVNVVSTPKAKKRSADVLGNYPTPKVERAPSVVHAAKKSKGQGNRNLLSTFEKIRESIGDPVEETKYMKSIEEFKDYIQDPKNIINGSVSFANMGVEATALWVEYITTSTGKKIGKVFLINKEEIVTDDFITIVKDAMNTNRAATLENLFTANMWGVSQEDNINVVSGKIYKFEKGSFRSPSLYEDQPNFNTIKSLFS